MDPILTRPICLMVPREATHRVLSDASYVGIGGWSPTFKFQWRIFRKDLLAVGFPIRLINKINEPEVLADNPGLNINPLEFLAVVINIWLTLSCLRKIPLFPTSYIVDFLSDNTTVLTWMKYADTTPDPFLCHLAHVSLAILVEAATHHVHFQATHTAGVPNHEADYLSRLVNGFPPSWKSVMNACSQLRTCQIFFLPSMLLSMLASLLSSRKTEVSYDTVMTNCLTLERRFLPIGSMKEDLTINMQLN